MGATVREWWDVLVHITDGMSELWRWALICLALSLVLTQWFKPWLACREISRFSRDRVLQMIAFLAGAVPLWVFSPNLDGFVVGWLVGTASPLVFKVINWTVRKRWPDLAKALSADSPTYNLSDYWRGRSPSRRDSGSE